MSIRPAAPTDLPFVYDCLCDLEETALPLVAFESIFQLNLTNPTIWYIIAEEGGEAVGFLSCHVQPLLHHAGQVGEIQELYVLPAWRSQHVGQQLVEYLATVARQEGWLTLEVSSNRRRTRAHAFYERLGFLPSHVKLVRALEE